MFGYRLIKESELKRYRRAWIIQSKATECRDVFSGWKDLDIIWSYLFDETYFGGIYRARKDYAKARGTDEYGVTKDEKEN